MPLQRSASAASVSRRVSAAAARAGAPLHRQGRRADTTRLGRAGHAAGQASTPGCAVADPRSRSASADRADRRCLGWPGAPFAAALRNPRSTSRRASTSVETLRRGRARAGQVRYTTARATGQQIRPRSASIGAALPAPYPPTPSARVPPPPLAGRVSIATASIAPSPASGGGLGWGLAPRYDTRRSYRGWTDSLAIAVRPVVSGSYMSSTTRAG
jgi:hypothetical protein